MRLRMWLGIGTALAIAGCAQMHVSKISAEKRQADRDGLVHGFRYYLSRPYVLVKLPIVVATETSLLVLDAGKAEAANDLFGKGSAPPIPPMTEPGKPDKPTLLPSVSKVNPGTGALEPVDPAEWQALRQVVEQRVAGSRVSSVAAPTAAAATAPAAGPSPSALRERTQRAAADVLPVQVAVPLPGPGPAILTTDAASDQASQTSRLRAADMLPAATAPAEGGKTVDLQGSIDVVFLPDLDEQYAVHNQNWLAKSSYALNFKDGWQLTGINGEFDSTTVAIELLKTIDSAVNTAKTVALAGLDTQAKLAAARKRAGAALKDAKDLDATTQQRSYVICQVTRTRTIPPGLYRINKPWEQGDTAPESGCGLLAKLGLHTVETVKVSEPEVLPPKP